MDYGTGFMNLSRILDVNKDQSENMATQLSQNTANTGDSARAGMAYGAGGAGTYGGDISKYSPGVNDQISNVDHDINNFKTQSGRGSLLKSTYGKAGGYDLGQQGLDAAISGSGAGATKLDSVSNAYSNLASQLGSAQQTAASDYSSQQAHAAAGLADRNTQQAQRDHDQVTKDAVRQAKIASTAAKLRAADEKRNWFMRGGGVGYNINDDRLMQEAARQVDGGMGGPIDYHEFDAPSFGGFKR